MKFPFHPFQKKNAPLSISYDPALQQPAVRRSICTGEMTGGFVDRETGRFQDYLLLEGDRELKAFCQSVGVRPEELKTIY